MKKYLEKVIFLVYTYIIREGENMKITAKSHPQIVKLLKEIFPDYKGRKFFLDTDTSIDPNYNANWDGGSKTEYRFLTSKNGTIHKFTPPDLAPWKRNYGETIELNESLACATRSWCCGYECGCTLHVAPQLAIA